MTTNAYTPTSHSLHQVRQIPTSYGCARSAYESSVDTVPADAWEQLLQLSPPAFRAQLLAHAPPEKRAQLNVVFDRCFEPAWRTALRKGPVQVAVGVGLLGILGGLLYWSRRRR